MANFEVERIYQIDDDGEIDVDVRQLTIDPELMFSSVKDLADSSSLSVSGLSPEDFALFARITDHTGDIVYKAAYLVAEFDESVASVTQSDHVEARPQSLATKYMAKKVLSLTVDDLNCFNLANLADALRQLNLTD